LTTPAGPRRAFDKRLLRFGRPVHAYLTAAVALGVGTAALTIGQALLLGWIIAEVFHGSGLGDVTPQLTGLLVIAVLRGLIVWATEAIAYRSAAATKSSLRRALLRRVVANRGTGSDPGAVVAAAGRGIEALDPYFARYLPQVVLALVVPLLVLMVVLAIDPWSALIIGATLPLIPVFAALTGTATRSRMSQRWQAFSDLSSGFVESVRSLPTLKVFGRSREAVARFGRLADAHRVETMGTLRIAFLSALALELAATISVAVVAVAVGLRVLGAGLELQPALTVLILAPEAYLPLRRLAAEFHSAAEGVEAAGRMLDEIEAPIEAPRSGSRAAPNHPGGRSVTRGGGGRLSGGDRSDRCRQEHPAERAHGIQPSRRRVGDDRRGTPPRFRRHGLVAADRLAAPIAAPVCRQRRRQRALRLTRRIRRSHRQSAE
jgi:ABC-type transport system involved in cytochrome bd biosynthesis fused ATPase/permease subunit